MATGAADASKTGPGVPSDPERATLGSAEGAGDDDSRVLASMGYKQDLYRGFSGWVMSFSICLTAVSV